MYASWFGSAAHLWLWNQTHVSQVFVTVESCVSCVLTLRLAMSFCISKGPSIIHLFSDSWGSSSHNPHEWLYFLMMLYHAWSVFPRACLSLGYENCSWSHGLPLIAPCRTWWTGATYCAALPHSCAVATWWILRPSPCCVRRMCASVTETPAATAKPYWSTPGPALPTASSSMPGRPTASAVGPFPESRPPVKPTT